MKEFTSLFCKGSWKTLTAFFSVLIAIGILMVYTGQAVAQPAYYPADYQKIIEASKKENKLLIYSNMAEYNWKHVTEGFNKLYPWIKVETLDLGSGTVFNRYYAEKGTKTTTGDMLISGAIDKWLDYIQRKEAIVYQTAERTKLPEWSIPSPGIFTVSTDPMVMVYNKMLLPEKMRPKGFADLVSKAKANPDLFKGKITTYNAGISSFGLAINWAFIRNHGEKGWEWFEAIGGLTRPEKSSGPMIAKITAGEYASGFFVSGISLFPKMDKNRKKIMGWNFFDDGTPLFMRGMSIPKGSTNINAAKLMVDFILSHDGQAAFGKGGLTPYRPDVSADEVAQFTYKTVVDAIGGEDNAILINYDQNMLSGKADFINRWKKTYSK